MTTPSPEPDVDDDDRDELEERARDVLERGLFLTEDEHESRRDE